MRIEYDRIDNITEEIYNDASAQLNIMMRRALGLDLGGFNELSEDEFDYMQDLRKVCHAYEQGIVSLIEYRKIDE